VGKNGNLDEFCEAKTSDKERSLGAEKFNKRESEREKE
jgi:hypothetical protein